MEFPSNGDNFRTVGPWRVLEGRGWQRWQTCAITAEITASELQDDMISAARLKQELRAMASEGFGQHRLPSR